MDDMSMFNQPYRRWLRCWILVCTCFLLLVGCTGVYRQTYDTAGGVLKYYARDHLLPHLMTTDDIEMACAIGEANTQMLLSLRRVVPRPNRSGLSALFAAGLCSQHRAFEAELRYQRALYEGNAHQARDAQIQMDRSARQAAKRQYSAYRMFRDEFGAAGGDCPVFAHKQEKLVYLMGLLAGVQALTNDFRTTQGGNVPNDLPSRASLASRCLDNKEWWGVPEALRATVWTIKPEKMSGNENPWKQLDGSIQKADRAGIRLPFALLVLAARNKSRKDLVKETIKKAVKSREKHPPPPRFQLLDAIAFRRMRRVSDHIWTKATGHRTPPGQLGTFPEGEVQQEQEDEFADLLPAPAEGSGEAKNGSRTESNQ